MTSITEDPSLPLDLDGTSNQLSNSSHFGNHDMTDQDVTNSTSSDLEHPGTFLNLTSAGKMSPHRTRTMKDQETQLGEYKKDNFGLKLRIYHLEEALRKKWGDSGDGWKMNIELQVLISNLKKEVADKDTWLMKAKSAIDQLTAQHDAHIKEMQKAAEASSQTEELEDLRNTIAERETDLEEALREVEGSHERMRDMQELNARLEDGLRDKENKLGRMEQELEDIQKALEAAAAAPPPVATRTAACQTSEPLVAQLDQAMEALEEAQSQLEDKNRETAELKLAMANKDKCIRDLEIELLSASQRLASGADDHAREMQDQFSDLDRCKGQIRDLEDKLRQKDDELRQKGSDLEGAGRQAREAEALVQRLQPLIQDRDREIQDLLGRLNDSANKFRENEQDRDSELRDLKGKLRDAESRAREAEPDLAAKQREIDRLAQLVDDKEDELLRTRSKLRETEEALSHARKSSHKAHIDNSEQADALKRLEEELAHLRNELQRQRDGKQTDLEAALAASNAVLEQVRRELRDAQDKLDLAEEKILHLTTSHAAETGVLRASIDDLNRQIEHLERSNRDLRNEVGQLSGEKASLEREVKKLQNEVCHLRDQLSALQNELAEKKRHLVLAEQAIADLQKVINGLQEQEHQQSGPSEAELAKLRSRLAAAEHTLRNKEAEVDSLKRSVSLKDRMIGELQDQLTRVLAERGKLEERIQDLLQQISQLENELATLRSHARISKLAADDLQSKLTLAFSDREDLARKLQLAEAALREKETTNGQFQLICDSLRDQIQQLQHQINDMSQDPPPRNVTITTHETTTTHEAAADSSGKKGKGAAKGTNSTTMIFGSPSENLLMTILQKLQELYGEITAGRTDTNIATSSLSSKLEHITNLQRHLERSLHDGQQPSQQEHTTSTSNPNSNNTSYTAYYIMRDEQDGELSVDEKHTAKESSTPNKSSPRRRKTSADLASAFRDATEQVEALQSELDEVKKWNQELQVRLDEAEHQSEDKGRVKNSDNYEELEREVDRLLTELDTERERSQGVRDRQQHELNGLHDQLKNTEDKVRELEQQLRLAMADSSSDTLHQEVDRLVSELDQARATIAALRGRLDAERNETSRLRSEVSDLRQDDADFPPELEPLAASSMPNLLTKSTSDSWTSPARGSQGMSEKPDVRELKQKHEEVTRLNQELQRKCREQLYRSPPHSRPSSGGQSPAYWHGKLREQEERLRSEMLERERGLLAQVRSSEVSFIERETDWKQVESLLRHQIVDLEAQLSEAETAREQSKRRADKLLVDCKVKDEEIVNRSRSLSMAQEKIQALEEQLDMLLREKNASISDLEEKVLVFEEELTRAQEREERLKRRLEVIENETDFTTLHETVDSLTQQLTSRIEDVEELQDRNRHLENEKTILTSQLASTQEQVGMLKEELTLFQKLLEDGARGREADETGRQDISPSVEKLIQLMEEVRELREQLDRGIHSNNTLADQYHDRLQHGATNSKKTTVHYTTHVTPASGQAASTQTSPSKGDLPKDSFSPKSGPAHTRVFSKSTSTGVPVSDKATNTKGQSTTRTDNTTVYVHHDSDTTIPPSFSETILSDTSTSSLSQQHPPPSQKLSVNVSTSTAPYSQPKGTSTPHTSSRHHSKPRSGRFKDKTDGQDVSFSRSSYSDRGVNTDGPIPPSQKKDKSSGSQPRSSASVNSRYTHTKTTTRRTTDVLGSGSDESGGSSSRRRTGREPMGDRHTTTFTLSGLGDFDSLETRLQQALNSSSLLAADRTFLEDLLIYLRQQRKQLDDSKRLLERLEQSTGIPTATHIRVETADSGTLPTPSRHAASTQVTPPYHAASTQVTPPYHAASTQAIPPRHTASTQATPTSVHASSNTTPRSSAHSTAQTTPHSGTHATAQTTPLQDTHSGTQTTSLHFTAQTTPLHGVHTQTTPLHGIHTQTTPLHGVYTQTTPLHGMHTQTTPLHGMHTQTTPLDSAHSGTQTAPPGGRRSHSTSTYSFHSETTRVPGVPDVPCLDTGTASFSEPHDHYTSSRVTRVTNGDHSGSGDSGGGESDDGDGGGAGGRAGSGRTRVDLSKLYEQLLQTHSSLAEARSALSQQRTQ